MATATLQAFDAIDALYAMLREREGLNGVDVRSGPVSRGNWVGNATVQVQTASNKIEWAHIGRQSRDEELEIAVAIGVIQSGNSEDAIERARQRARDLTLEVDAALAEDRSLRGTTRVASISSVRVDQGSTDLGRWVEVEITVTGAMGRIRGG